MAARPRTGAVPRESPAWPEENRNWWLRRSLLGARGERAVRGCRPPGLPAVVPQARDPAARPALPRRRAPGSLPLSSCSGRHHGGPPPRVRTPAASSAPARRRRPAATTRPGLSGPLSPSRGTAPVQGAPATPPALQTRHRWPDTSTRTPHATPATSDSVLSRIRCPVRRRDLGRTIFSETPAVAIDVCRVHLAVARRADVSAIFARQIACDPRVSRVGGQYLVRRTTATDKDRLERIPLAETGQTPPARSQSAAGVPGL